MKKVAPWLLSALCYACCSACLGCGGCDRSGVGPSVARPVTVTEEEAIDSSSSSGGDPQLALRRAMVETQLAGRDITDRRVLLAMEKVPRHLFVPRILWSQAYADYPLPIDHDQTISQPYIVAFMSQVLQLDGTERVLEVGTGSGYQAAVLAELCREVHTIEIIPELSQGASKTLKQLGYSNVHLRVGDGWAGWPEKAPFDAIMVTAAPPRIPQPLIDQLSEGGRMILPVGDLYQDLVLVEKTPEGVTRQKVLPVRFVPMTGQAQKRDL